MRKTDEGVSSTSGLSEETSTNPEDTELSLSQLGMISKQETDKSNVFTVIAVESSESSSLADDVEDSSIKLEEADAANNDGIVTINIDALEERTRDASIDNVTPQETPIKPEEIKLEEEIAGKLDESFTIAVETSSGESSTGDGEPLMEEVGETSEERKINHEEETQVLPDKEPQIEIKNSKIIRKCNLSVWVYKKNMRNKRSRIKNRKGLFNFCRFVVVIC